MITFQKFWNEIKDEINNSLKEEIDESRLRMDIIIGAVIKRLLEEDNHIEITRRVEGNKIKRKNL